MNKLGHPLYRVLVLIAAFAVFFTFSPFFTRSAKILSSVQNSEQQYLHNNWTVYLHNQTFTDVTLNTFRFSPLSRGDKAILVTSIPETNIKNPVLIFTANYAAVDVYSGSSLLYTYGHDQLNKGLNTGCGPHIIPLNEIQPGQEIIIELLSTQNATYTFFQPVYIVNSSNFYPVHITSKLFIFISAIFLFFLGGLGSALFIVLGLMKKPVTVLLLLSQFALWVGIGVLANNDLLLLFTPNRSLISFWEYMALYLTGFSLIGLFYKTVASVYLEKIITRILFFLHLAYFISVITLEMLSFVHFSSTLIMWQLLALISLIYAVFVSGKHILFTHDKNPANAVGFLLLVFFCLLDLLRYFIYNYTTIHSATVSGSMLSLGSIGFIVCLIIYFFTQEYSYVGEKIHTTYQIKYSETDYLTGLYNRQRCQEFIKQFAKQKEIEYSVISISFDNYQELCEKINTAKADSILQTFASHLRKIFSSYGIVGRISDSRFIIVSSGLMENKIIQLIFSLKQIIRSMLKNSPETLNFSCGYAFSRETDDSDIYAACALAEKRMKLITENNIQAGAFSI